MDRKKVKDLRTKCHSFLVFSLPKCKDDLILIPLAQFTAGPHTRGHRSTLSYNKLFREILNKWLSQC